MRRSHWLILAVGCGVAMLYLMIGAWQDIAFVSSGERLGLMIGFAIAGGEYDVRRGMAERVVDALPRPAQALLAAG